MEEAERIPMNTGLSIISKPDHLPELSSCWGQLHVAFPTVRVMTGLGKWSNRGNRIGMNCGLW